MALYGMAHRSKHNLSMVIHSFGSAEGMSASLRTAVTVRGSPKNNLLPAVRHSGTAARLQAAASAAAAVLAGRGLHA